MSQEISDLNRRTKIIALKSADELINILLDGSFSSVGDSIFVPNRWVYRGHAASSWDLIPSAYRSDNKANLLRLAGRVNSLGENRETSLIYAEYMILFRFYKELEQQGVEVPDNSPWLREFFESPSKLAFFLMQCRRHEELYWPPPEIHGLVALAQHHGIPTRLLDWSYDPLMACYFASNQHKDAPLSIWCLDCSYLFNHKSKLKLINAPGYSNPNLHAQKGLFVARKSSFFEKDFDAIEYIGPLNSDHGFDGLSEGVVYYKIDLPGSERGRLKDLVRRLGYTSSRIFPGVDGIAKEVMEYLPSYIPNFQSFRSFNIKFHVFMPIEWMELANSIASLLDPDIGGHKSFSVILRKFGETSPAYCYSGGPVGRDVMLSLFEDFSHNIDGFYYYVSGADIRFTNIQYAPPEVTDCWALASVIGLERMPSLLD